VEHLAGLDRVNELGQGVYVVAASWIRPGSGASGCTMCATLMPPSLATLGVASKIVSDRLGHASESVTQQIYTHPSTGQDRPAAEMIAGLIAEAFGR
jgi:hypothetical protein